jgi:hypothetical protein
MATLPLVIAMALSVLVQAYLAGAAQQPSMPISGRCTKPGSLFFNG